MDSDGRKDAVYGRSRNVQQGSCDLFGELSEGFTISGQPDRQDDFETFGAGQICRDPDFFERVDDGGVLIDWRFTSLSGPGLGETFEPSEDPDCMFTVTPVVGAEFVQDGCLFMSRGIFISTVDCLQILLLGLWTHNYPSLLEDDVR